MCQGAANPRSALRIPCLEELSEVDTFAGGIMPANSSLICDVNASFLGLFCVVQAISMFGGIVSEGSHRVTRCNGVLPSSEDNKHCAMIYTCLSGWLSFSIDTTTCGVTILGLMTTTSTSETSASTPEKEMRESMKLLTEIVGNLLYAYSEDLKDRRKQLGDSEIHNRLEAYLATAGGELKVLRSRLKPL